MAELKHDHFYGRLPKWVKAMVAYLQASLQGKMYSDYLWATREAKKEDSMEPSQSQTAETHNQTQGNEFLPSAEVRRDPACS